MSKKKTKKTTSILISLAVLGFLIFLFVGKVIPLDEEGFMKVRLYDENGNLITSNTLSVVGGVPGVSFIDITVTVTNTGNTPLTCSLVEVTPTAFSTALNPSSKFVPSSAPNKASWTSQLISVSQFEGLSQPTVFSVKTRCSYVQGASTIFLPDKTGTISLTILPDTSGADFNVNLASGGTGTEYCGDTVCQSSETAVSCPNDCAVSANVRFRTSDLSYVSGSAVAFNPVCGSPLIAYGDASILRAVNLPPGGCPVRTGYTILSSGLPGGSICGVSCSGVICLYSVSGDPTQVEVAQYNTNTTSWQSRVYDSDDPDKTKVDTSGLSFDRSKELVC